MASCTIVTQSSTSTSGNPEPLEGGMPGEEEEEEGKRRRGRGGGGGGGGGGGEEEGGRGGGGGGGGWRVTICTQAQEVI